MFSFPPSSDAARNLAFKHHLSLTASNVLVHRGVVADDDVTSFLEPRLARLSTPSQMVGRAEAASRIARAVRAGERICVFGDYDADGITSAAIITDILRTLGGVVDVRLADRFRGGYGLSNDALDRVRETGATLLITCDCGSSDHERLAKAREFGLDVIVIDHHRVPEDPLPAFAFLNPHRPECPFPFKGLASCGLALSLCAAVRAELGATLDVRNWLDLVALGTIADVAPLNGDNRPLVRAGLVRLGSTTRPGVKALLRAAKQSPSLITAEDVAFRLAPRINAPGRLGKPDLALDLLLARSDDEASQLASRIDDVSEQRKLLDRAMFDEALKMLDDPAMAALPAIVLGKLSWNPGVVGIVAGRLASRMGKPTVIVGHDGTSARGSARAPNGFRLYDALELAKDALIGFGGHQAAAGVHLDFAKLDAFRERFAAACAHLGATTGGVDVLPSGETRLEPSDDPRRVLADFERFEPCGHSNPLPQIVVERARVQRVFEMRGGYVRFDADTGGSVLPCFAFDLELPTDGEVSLLGSLRRETYRRTNAVEMRVQVVHGGDSRRIS